MVIVIVGISEIKRLSIDLQNKSAHSGYQDQAMWILSIFYIKVSALIISSISNPSIFVLLQLNNMLSYAGSNRFGISKVYNFRLQRGLL